MNCCEHKQHWVHALLPYLYELLCVGRERGRVLHPATAAEQVLAGVDATDCQTRTHNSVMHRNDLWWSASKVS